MPPPTTLRQRRALAMSSFDAQSTEPTGAPSPFDRHTETESKWRLISVTGTFRCTAALNTRAPSRCRPRPLCTREFVRAFQVGERQHLAALSILEAQEPRLRKMRIVGLDGGFDAAQIE
jgi:hypothetical protein